MIQQNLMIRLKGSPVYYQKLKTKTKSKKVPAFLESIAIGLNKPSLCRQKRPLAEVGLPGELRR